MLYEHHFLSQREYDDFTKACSGVENWMIKIYEIDFDKKVPKDCLDALSHIF